MTGVWNLAFFSAREILFALSTGFVVFSSNGIIGPKYLYRGTRLKERREPSEGSSIFDNFLVYGEQSASKILMVSITA